MSNLMSHSLGAWSEWPDRTCRDFRGGTLTLHRLGEIGKELIGQFLGRTVDQALAELGQLAADLRLDIVGQQGAAILFGQRHRRATLGEPCDAALAFPRNLVAVRRIEIAE